MKHKKKRRTRRNGRTTLFMTVIAVMIIVAVFLCVSPSIKELIAKVTSPYSVLKDVNKNIQANISNYNIYGTHFNIDGSMQLDLDSDIEEATLVYRDYKGKETEYSLIYEVLDNKINFATSETINTGINLEEVPVGNYFALLKITYAKDENTKVDNKKSNDEATYDNIKYYSLSDTSDNSEMTYYTITKNSSNNRIDIGFETVEIDKSTISILNVKSKECELPDDVYDIVIDAGHGGADGGTVNEKYTEANIVLDFAIELKDKLEELGLKVKLTRDGTEDITVPMAYTMYDEDGRVNIAGDSKAKLCISLHLNSYDGILANGGLQIYCPYNIDTTFASALSNEIIKESNTYASTMKAHSIGEGIYCRTLNDSDIKDNIAAAKKGGYDPYNLDTTINYYYIIRELGGKVTGAYIDGRNEKYGKNKYFDSNIGIETYLIELGYITHDEDLNNLLNNQSGYVKGIVNAIKEQFLLFQ